MAIFEPIRLWSYDHGRLRDVTRSYSTLTKRDAAELWDYYLAYRGGRRSVRWVLAAWAADQYMLGRPRAVDRALTRAVRRGYLAFRYGDSGPRDPVAYIRLIKQFLRETGYIRG